MPKLPFGVGERRRQSESLASDLEDLRTEFYREIKKFISIPTGFKGLGYFEEGAAGKHKVLWSPRSPGTLTMTGT